jgi:hypothetical protein
LPVDPKSDSYINTIGRDAYVHADFGSGIWPPGDGGPIGIPYVVVPGNQARVPISFYYDDESDPGPYPIPDNPPIEGGPNSDGDRHILILDEDNCILYEIYDAYPEEDGSWEAGSGAIYDLSSHMLRPDGWTSADAAGLPILPGLVRYDEVLSGEINHAIRFTVEETRRAYLWPARHFASDLTGQQYPPMGQRFRLRADFNLNGFAPEVQVILRAMKKYGIILADNGSPWFISGVPDERWDNDTLRQLHQLTGDDFEAVDVSSLMVDPDSGQADVSPEPPLPFRLYLSMSVAGSSGGVAYAAADILDHNNETDQWSIVFDGSDVGVSKNLAALARLDDDSLLMSFATKTTLPTLGAVQPHDVVRFVPSTTGGSTAGTFSWYFDGSDVALTATGEKIDAVAVLPNGRFLLSTTGAAKVPGVNAQDEDLLLFTPTSTGATTAGTWSLYLDGSAVSGMAKEDITSVWLDPANNDLYLTLQNNFTIGGVQGGARDILRLRPSANTFTPSIFWRGANNALSADIDALDIEFPQEEIKKPGDYNPPR